MSFSFVLLVRGSRQLLIRLAPTTLRNVWNIRPTGRHLLKVNRRNSWKKKMGAAAAAWRKPIPKWNHCQCRRRKGEHFQIEMKIGSRVIGARNGPMLQPLCSSGTFPFKWTAHRGRLRFNCPAVAFSSGHCEKNTKMKEDSIPVSPRFSSGPEKKKKFNSLSIEFN